MAHHCTVEGICVWLDIFAVNQHPGQEQSDDLANLQLVIKEAKQTLLIMDSTGQVSDTLHHQQDSCHQNDTTNSHGRSFCGSLAWLNCVHGHRGQNQLLRRGRTAPLAPIQRPSASLHAVPGNIPCRACIAACWPEHGGAGRIHQHQHQHHRSCNRLSIIHVVPCGVHSLSLPGLTSHNLPLTGMSLG